jgi:hypothetical protein
MALLNCICPIPLGSESCTTQTGISELYYTPFKNIEGVVFDATASTCCTEGEIASFALVATAPDGLLQPINFVQQDDDTGALYTESHEYDTGNNIINDTFVFQVNAGNPNEQCTLRSLVGQQVAFLYKGKDGFWKFVNWAGGMKVATVQGNSNQSYYVVTLTGRANKPALYVSYTDAGVWASTHLVPVSVVPLTGMINA